MKNTLNVQFKNYFKEIKKELSCNHSTKTAFIINIKENIHDYILDNPNATIEEVTDVFGNPKEITKNFENYYTDDLKRKASKIFRYRIVCLSLSFLLAISIIITIVILQISGGDVVISNPY